jgi:putative transposase
LLLKHITKSTLTRVTATVHRGVHAELTLGLGLVVNEKGVAWLMRQAGIRGLCVRRRRGFTVRNRPPSRPVTFQPAARRGRADRLWVTDITKHPTVEGMLYCAAVLDVYSRRIVG